MEVYGNTSDSQLNFLMQVLRATAESSGNAQVVYPLLEANLDKLNDDFADILREWTKNTLSKSHKEESQRLASTIYYFCQLLEQFPDGDRESNIEIVIAGYEIITTILTREAFPKKWVDIQTEIGIAYKNRIRGDQIENLEIAIEAYQKVLAVCIQHNFDRQLAIAQDNLCYAYAERMIGDRAENLEMAVQAAEAALKVFNQQDFLKDWATVKVNLAGVYQNRIHGEPDQNLQLAIKAYQEALQVFTQERFPQYWAVIQHNLALISERFNVCREILRVIEESGGDPILDEYCDYLDDSFANILRIYSTEKIVKLTSEEDDRTQYSGLSKVQSFGVTIDNFCQLILNFSRGNRASNVEIAIAGWKILSKVFTRKDFPILWARTQSNLGEAYRQRIRGDRSSNLEYAIQLYLAASEEFHFHHDAYAEFWASTQSNLGTAYLYRIQGEKTENLELAIKYLISALDERDSQTFPQEWAKVKINLGEAYRLRIQENKAENLEVAIRCYLEVLQELTQEKDPYPWAMAHNNLGNVYGQRIWGERAENLEKAIQCYQSALRVRTRENFPKDWATTQNNLGLVYTERIREEKEGNLEIAINYFKAALQIRTREAFPQDWATTQNNLGEAYRLRIQGNKAENLEVPIKCFKAALKVRTPQSFPIEWIETTDNLGNAYVERIRGNKAENIETGIKFHLAALDVLKQISLPETWAKCQMNLGASYSKRIEGERNDNLSAAIDCFQSAVSVFTCHDFPQNYIGVQSNLGIVYQEVKDFSHAYNAFKSAIDTVELLRDEIATNPRKEKDKQKLAEQWNQLYKNMVEVCLELDKTIEAIEYIERSKTRNLVEQILSHDLKTIFPAEVVTQLERYRDEIATGQYQIQNSKAENPKVLAKHLQELRQQRNELQNQYLPVGYGFKFDSFQATLDEHTTIIEWYLLNDKILAFIVKPKGEEALLALWIKWYREIQNIKLVEAAKLNLWFISLTYYLISREVIVWQSQPEDLEALVNWVGEYLQDYYKTGKNQWRDKLDERLKQLSEILYLESILDLIPEEQYNRLILIPHRFLHLLPIHALPVGESYLLDRFSQGVGYAPSCQLLQQVQQRKRPDFQSLFAIQNPTGDLEFTDQEVNSILSLFPSHQVLSHSKATKAALDEATPHLQEANYLHFSCHGSFNPDSPFLLLADAIVSSIPANADPQQYLESSKGFIDLSKCLTLGNLFERGFDLNKCRLVVLSACETGLIDFNNNSDEYIGLPSGFLYAGSSSVVSSLWTVDDMSTAYLMIKFLQNLKAAKDVSVAVALNQAQHWLRNSTWKDLKKWANDLQLDSSNHPETERSMRQMREIVAKNARNKNIDEKPFQSPYHWAGFTAIGR